MIILIKLFLAHLAGDFFLQPKSWVRAKEKNKLKAYQLYAHSLLHGIIIMILVWDLDFLPWAALLAFVHLTIDAAKVMLQKKNTKRTYFFIDQFAHFISIGLIYYGYQGNSDIFTPVFNEAGFFLATAIVFLTLPCSFGIKMFIAKWSPHTEEDEDESLHEAGKFIGILERLFVFVFIITAHWEAVGFLIAAKSIFRFGDLKESKDRKLTEYVLIGTLLSFGIAILTGIIYTGAVL
jgi:hypothetical protein